MNLSLFEVVGPVMIGPSSSHTAGAARLARVAALIADRPFQRVEFGLHGSFAKTGRGHGTDKALLAGAMGIREDDEAIRDAFSLAEQRGLAYSFYEVDLPDSHENSARITFFHLDGTRTAVEGSSIGGGRIRINQIDGMAAGFSAESPTLLISQKDVTGVVSEISRTLADEKINIGVMRLSREARGKAAVTVLETDSPIPERVARRLRTIPNILSVRIIDLNR